MAIPSADHIILLFTIHTSIYKYFQITTFVERKKEVQEVKSFTIMFSCVFLSLKITFKFSTRSKTLQNTREINCCDNARCIAMAS